jgi:anti-sigma regulatory factor (Ser/Thr protein kinase)
MSDAGHPLEADAHFPADGSSAGGARRFVRATLEAWDLAELDEVASLLVSELVSNVVLHAETDLDLLLRRSEGRVRVEVHDRNPRLPERKFYSPTAATGRGLVFIAELAQAWGAEPTPGGKSVWFELDETPPASPAGSQDTEFRLEDWDDDYDWGDLEPAAAPDEQRPPTGATSALRRTSPRSLGRCAARLRSLWSPVAPPRPAGLP